MNAPSSILTWSFGLGVLLMLLLTLRSLSRRGAAVLGGIWMVLTGGLAFSGILLNFSDFPPPLLRLVLPGLLSVALWCLSPWAKPYLQSWTLAGMVAFQAFRLPLELLMHQAAREGVMPPQMTFTGRNFDILTGLLALPLAAALRRAPQSAVPWVWLWNLAGLGLLLNVVGVAILSVPGPLRHFWNDPPNLWVATFPFVWLPTVLVPLALAGHILIFRKLCLRQTMD